MGKAISSVAVAVILLLASMTVVSGSAQAGIENKNAINFIILSYITLGISLLLLIYAFIHLMMKRREKARVEKRVTEGESEEEIIKMIKEIKELKKRLEKRGESLTSASDIFLGQVLMHSEVRSINKALDGINQGIEGVNKEIFNTRTLALFGLEMLVALCLAIISMLFVIMSMV